MPILEICCPLRAEEVRELSKYVVAICRTGNSGEAQTSAIKLRGDDQSSLGYVFPVTAFRNTFEDADQWEVRYAHVGFRSLCKIEILGRIATPLSLDRYRQQRINLDELIPDDLSVLVLGRENLEKKGVSPDALPLMLLREGVFVLGNIDLFLEDHTNLDLRYGPTADQIRPWQRNISVSIIDGVVAEDAAIFTTLLRAADQSKIDVGCFLLLYQVIEFCIDQIFGWGISDLVNPGISTVELKRRLNVISSQKQRLHILGSYCLSDSVAKSEMNSLALSCSDLLKISGIDVNTSSGWPKLLYDVRNLVVHDHLKILKAKNVDLKDVNACLRSACLEILFGFAQPEFSAVWVGSNEA